MNFYVHCAALPDVWVVIKCDWRSLQKEE